MQSSGDFIKSITLVYTVLLLTQIILLCISIWEIVPERDDDYDRQYQIADVIVFVLCMAGSYYAFSNKQEKARKPRGIREKLIIYRSGLFIQWAILAFLSLFSIVSYIMTGDFLFIFATVFSIIAFILNRPSINRTCDDLDLDNNERRVLKTKDAAI